MHSGPLAIFMNEAMTYLFFINIHVSVGSWNAIKQRSSHEQGEEDGSILIFVIFERSRYVHGIPCLEI